jgi:hypothetical protein
MLNIRNRLNLNVFLFSILISPLNFAAPNPGPLFNVQTTGGALSAPIHITLCLNATAPLSCQEISVDASELMIKSTAPHRYPTAGIKINTPGYVLASPGAECTPLNNGYCAFSLSHTQSTSIGIRVAMPHQPLLFVASTTTQANFNVNDGADKFCARNAAQSTLFNPQNYSYKALIITSKRYPCDYVNGAPGCGNGFAADWPLSPNTTYYYPDGQSVFNTTNNHAVFDGSMAALQFENGSSVDSDHLLLIGIQSVLANAGNPPTDIAGWGYHDLNPGTDPTNDGNVYNSWSPRNCHDWTDNTGPGLWNAAVGLANNATYVAMDPQNPVPVENTWGNYYIWQNNDVNSGTYFVNLWSVSYLSDCPSLGYVVCVATA